jgi:hypothetical protein
VLVLAASPLVAIKPTTASSGTTMSSILVWMLTLLKNRGRFSAIMDTAYVTFFRGSRSFGTKNNDPL